MAPYGTFNKQSPGDGRVVTEQAFMDRLLKTCLRHVEGPDRVTLYKSLQRRDAESILPASSDSITDTHGQRVSGAKDGRTPRRRTGDKAAAAVSNGR